MALQMNAQPVLEKIETVDVPGHTQEIVQYCASERLLLATNTQWKTVDLYAVESLDPPVLWPIDLDEVEVDPQGFTFAYEPTSVAVHPTQPIAFVSVLGRGPTHRGTVVAFDLRRGVDVHAKPVPEVEASSPAARAGLVAGDRFGGLVMLQEVGFHPDSLSVSPDGRWLLVACEAEGDPDSPGSVWAVDLEGLTADRRAREGALPSFELEGLSKLLRRPAGDLEPEYVAFDPQSRFAVVTLQENDAFVTVDLQSGSRPRLSAVTTVSFEGEPDGIDVMDGVAGPEGRVGCLVAVAEEGKFNKFGQTTGNLVSFWWVDPLALDKPAVRLGGVDVRPLLDSSEPTRRRDPETIKLVRLGGRVLALVAIERGDQVMLLDVSDASQPVLLAKPKAGDRPEGMTLVRSQDGQSVIVITGDEGAWGPGTLTFLRLSSGR